MASKRERLRAVTTGGGLIAGDLATLCAGVSAMRAGTAAPGAVPQDGR